MTVLLRLYDCVTVHYCSRDATTRKAISEHRRGDSAIITWYWLDAYIFRSLHAGALQGISNNES
jgi:hypothetical protein